MKKLGETCVYLHLRKRRVFYVGIGSINRSQATRGRPASWYEMCPDKQFSVRIYRKGLSRTEAEKLEMSLVQNFRNKGYQLANSIITKPGTVAIDVLAGDEGSQNSRLEVRSLSVPWLMLDSFSSAGQPFRMQITFCGETKRMFASTLPDLVNDVCRHFGHAYEAKKFATEDRLRKLAQLRNAFDYLIRHGAKAFLERYAEPKRHAETLSEYIKGSQIDWRHRSTSSESKLTAKDRFYHSGPPMRTYPPCTDWPQGPLSMLDRFIGKVGKFVPSASSAPSTSTPQLQTPGPQPDPPVPVRRPRAR